MEPAQTPEANAVVDGIAPKTQRLKLVSSDDPVLAARQSGDRTLPPTRPSENLTFVGETGTRLRFAAHMTDNPAAIAPASDNLTFAGAGYGVGNPKLPPTQPNTSRASLRLAESGNPRSS